MGESVKELMDNLDKIVRTCKDIPRVIEIGCRNVGRNKSYQLLLVEGALRMAQQEREINSDKTPKVLIVGTESSFRKIEQWDIIRRVLESNSIQVEFVNMALPSMGSFNKDRIEQFSVSRGVGKSFDIQRLLCDSTTGYMDDLVVRENFKQQDRKIPIPGKSSKKGKNNPQCGSKFHR